ncbi:MAG: GyrI-like domain-containing protein, partial [Candidatus Kapaibacterium sp.]
MNSKPVSKAAFTLVGISARTTNAKEMSGHGIIAKQWQHVMSDKLIEKIPNRTDSNIIAMYTDYESDANGEYTFFIGARVKFVDSIPEGMVVKHVPAAHYALFTSEKGPVWEVVPKLWQKIWSTPPSEMGGERSFLSDFEMYDERAADPGNAIVDVWVG